MKFVSEPVTLKNSTVNGRNPKASTWAGLHFDKAKAVRVALLKSEYLTVPFFETPGDEDGRWFRVRPLAKLGRVTVTQVDGLWHWKFAKRRRRGTKPNRENAA